MKSWLCVIVCLILQIAAAEAQETTCGVETSPLNPASMRADRLEAEVDAAIEQVMAEHRVLGGVVVITKDGETALTKGYGFADLDRTDPINPNTDLFRVASVTKLFTALTAMDLVEEGGLALDAPLSSEGIGASFSHPVTLRQLLTHTAGFEEAGLRHYDGRPPHKNDAEPSFFDFLRETAPQQIYPVGTTRAYSNFGYSTIASEIERVTAMSYGNAVKTRILDPFDMGSTSADVVYPSDLEALRTPGFLRTSDGHKGAPEDYPRTRGASGLLTSAPDMAKFMAAMMAPPGEIADGLSGDVRRSLMAPLRAEHACATKLGAAAWIEDRGAIRMTGHGGDGVGYVAEVLMIPQDRLGIFFAFNTSAFAATQDLKHSLLANWYPAQIATSKPIPDALVDAMGEYHGARRAERHFGGVALLVGDAVATLSQLSDDTIAYNGAPYTHVGDGVFVGPDLLSLVFIHEAGARATFLARGTQVFERVDVHETILFRWAVLLAVLISAVALLIWFALRKTGRASALGRGSIFSLTISALAPIAVFTAIAMIGADPVHWQFGPPLPVTIALGLSVLLPVLPLAPVAAFAASFRAERPEFLHFAAAIVTLSIALWMGQHDLIGWDF